MSVPTISPQTLRLLIQTVKGFSPPPPVAALKDTVDLDLLLGAQLLWTAVMRKPISYGVLSDWLALTMPNSSPHRFIGSSLGEDSEVGGDLSSTFSKVAALAFMGDFAGTCWFKILRPLWGEILTTKNGDIAVAKRDADADGPDYLAAPFDPTNTAFGGPFYALEFKGHKAKVELSSEVFKTWSAQASNISLTTSTGAPVNLKSWVLGFNYGFETPRGSREESALLVEDPEIAPGRELLGPDRVNGSSIIRDHLARQCVLLGASALAPFVRLGLPLDVKSLPPVYKIDHPKLTDRRYIGHWFAPTPSGVFLPALAPWWPSIRTRMSKGPGWFHLRDSRARVEVFVDGDASVIGSIFGGDCVFIGQDATMLRRCTQVALDAPLDDEPFQDELHFVYSGGDAPYASTIRVLRNGSVVAANAAIELDDEPFWARG